jgi:D-arabinose 1-dehydrogenase-like Zn-dependent alcohol dehydrogenase
MPLDIDHSAHGFILLMFRMVSTRLLAVRTGTTLALIGVGGVGRHALQIARLAGGWVIAVDVNGARLELARALGADAVYTKQEQQETMDLVARGRIKPIVDRVIPLPDIEDVFAALREGRPLGRNVLAI